MQLSSTADATHHLDLPWMPLNFTESRAITLDKTNNPTIEFLADASRQFQGGDPHD